MPRRTSLGRRCYNPSKFEKSKTDCSDENHYAGMEILEQIKEKFQKSASNSEKVLLLTLAPKSWSCKEWL